MNLVVAALLGVVQGLSEFLPISSTAHLILIPWFFGLKDPGQTFDVALHLGTLIAVVGYFWRDWVDLLRRPGRMLVLIALACAPAAVLGKLFEDRVEQLTYPSQHTWAPLLMVGGLVLAGVLLYAADRWCAGRRREETLKAWEALGIGFAQAVALIPGVSRSGATISAGLAFGLTRAAAARFSFLLSTPIIAGAVGLKAVHVAQHGIPAGETSAFLVGILTSAVSGYLAIHFLLEYVKKSSLAVFVWYRFAFAVLTAVVWVLRSL
ncbi:MAG: undecaprenyl-diphosphate phosphatase [Armatimonadota bacterium]